MPRTRQKTAPAPLKDQILPECPVAGAAPLPLGPATPAQEQESSRIAPTELPLVRRSPRLNGENEHFTMRESRGTVEVTFQGKGKGKTEEDLEILSIDGGAAPGTAPDSLFLDFVEVRTTRNGGTGRRGRSGGRGRGRSIGRGRGTSSGRGRRVPIPGDGFPDGNIAVKPEEAHLQAKNPRQTLSCRRKLCEGVVAEGSMADRPDSEAKRLRHQVILVSDSSDSSSSESSHLDGGDAAAENGPDRTGDAQMSERDAEAGPSTPQMVDREEDVGISGRSEGKSYRGGGGRGRRGRGSSEASRSRFLEIARRRAAHFAHFDAEGDEAPAGAPPPPTLPNHYRRRRGRRVEDDNREQPAPLSSVQEEEDWPGPFSTARRLVEGRAAAAAARQQATKPDIKAPLVDWKPSRSPFDPSFYKRTRQSLHDMCLAIVTANADKVESLEGVPDFLKSRISAAFCERRQMVSRVLSLFFQGEPSEIRVPDCSHVSETELTEIMAQLSASRLEELHLGLCGRSLSERCLLATIARAPNFLPILNSLLLNGAYQLTDKSLGALLQAAPLVTRLDLSQCSFLSEAGIKAAVDYVGTTLKSLVLDGCKQLDASKLLSSLVGLPQLQKLSIAGVGGVNDEIVSELLVQIGSHLQELSLAQCSSLTDKAMAAVGACCPSLKVLKLDCLSLLTDITIACIADGCRMLQILTLTRCKFSDEAVAAFVTASGSLLTELSVNAVRQVSDQTLVALAQNSKGFLRRLDASWCRQMSDEALGFLADSCQSLTDLRLFGCTQVTDKFLKGHSNPLLEVIGL